MAIVSRFCKTVGISLQTSIYPNPFQTSFSGQRTAVEDLLHLGAARISKRLVEEVMVGDFTFGPAMREDGELWEVTVEKFRERKAGAMDQSHSVC